MTQTNGNGSNKPDPKDLEVFEPVFLSGLEEEENVGWFGTNLKGEEGKVISDSELPPELRGKPDEPTES